MNSLPSLRFHFLTPFYDFLFRVLLPEKKIRQMLLEVDSITHPEHILEIGCGTGSFTVMLSQRFLLARISAIDTDEKAISILTEKISQLKINNVKPLESSATMLPFQAESFDAVYSSLLFCNLSYDEKLKAITDVKRVLKNGGEFLIAEWGRPQTLTGKVGFIVLQWVGGKANTHDLKKGMLKNYLMDARFQISKKQYVNTLFGTIDFYEAIKLK